MKRMGATRLATDAALAGAGGISGIVTDAGGTLHHGLAGVYRLMRSQSTGAFGFELTAANGDYSVGGLVAATDYTVCFTSAGAVGGTFRM